MSNKSKIITLKIPLEDLELIEKAVRLDRRTRNSFMQKAGVDRAKEILREGGHTG